MGKPSRTRDVVGAVIMLLVGLLYMTGVSNLPVAHEETEAGAAVDVREVSHPVSAVDGPDIRT